MVGVTNNLQSLADNIKFIEGIVPQNNPVVNNQNSVGRSFDELAKTSRKITVLRKNFPRIK